MDCECAFAEPVRAKSRAAQSGISPEHDSFNSGFSTAAGNMAVQRRAQKDAADANSPAKASPIAGQEPHSPGQPSDFPTHDFTEPGVGRKLSSVRLQAKPTANTPGDAHEQQADRVADKVVGTPPPGTSPVPAPAAAGGAQTVPPPGTNPVPSPATNPAAPLVTNPAPPPGTNPAAPLGTSPAPPPGTNPVPPPALLRETACVTENLDEENRRSHLSPGRATVRTSPPPIAFSLFNYANDESSPKPDHIEYMRLVGPLLARNRIAVRLVGHASCPGSAAYNLELSQDRADIFTGYLKDVHVDVREAKGVGESQPVADNSTPEGRSRNRAVDMIPVTLPSFHLPSLCELFPIFCSDDRKPKNPCEEYPALCQVPNFCQWIPFLCEPHKKHKKDDDDDDDDDSLLPYCVRHPIKCCAEHPVICVCALAPELCLACIEDPALCIGIADCLANPASCTSPPDPDKPKPNQPPGAVSVLFTRVRAFNTPEGVNDRIPDKGATSVAAIVMGWRPSMAPIRITAGSAGGINGDAWINGARELSITGSTIFQVQGISQTSPMAPVLPLSLRATMGVTPVGQSAPFAVADLIENMTTTLDAIAHPDPALLVAKGAVPGVNVLKTPDRVGMITDMGWDSDGAQERKSLDEVGFNLAFRVLTATGVFAQQPVAWGTSWRGNMAGISLDFVNQAPLTSLGRMEALLVGVQQDQRSHSEGAIVNSGFKLEEVAEQDPSGNCHMKLSLTGSPADVRGFSSNAAGGVAQTTIPIQCPATRQIKESPLTVATAKTVPQLVPQLDQTHYGVGTVALNSGANNTVGLDMMTRFLTVDHSPGSEDTDKAQKNIYGFGKLPTLRAFRDPQTGRSSGYQQTQVYIKGHLLNANLGGPAEDRNLFPITGQANKDHNLEVEEHVKDLVTDQRLVALYGVHVDGQNGPYNIDVLGDGTCTYEYLDADFQCTYGTYTLYTDNTVEPLSTTNKPIHSRFDLGGFISGVRAKNCSDRF